MNGCVRLNRGRIRQVHQTEPIGAGGRANTANAQPIIAGAQRQQRRRIGCIGRSKRAIYHFLPARSGQAPRQTVGGGLRVEINGFPLVERKDEYIRLAWHIDRACDGVQVCREQQSLFELFEHNALRDVWRYRLLEFIVAANTGDDFMIVM